MHPHNFITLGNITIWSFAGLIAVGTFLLILPQSVNGPALTPVDALFTATSATCVTGLVVVDTGSRLVFWTVGGPRADSNWRPRVHDPFDGDHFITGW